MTVEKRGVATLVATEDRIDFFHRALSEWISDPGITIACGVWEDGAISELMPYGKAQLLPGIYSGEFSGVRELQLTDSPHHLHVDLRKIGSVCFTVVPSVCLGFKPSFEIRLLAQHSSEHSNPRACISLMLGEVYSDEGVLNPATATRFFNNARHMLKERPELVTLEIKPEVHEGQLGHDLLQIVKSVCGLEQDDIDWPDALTAMGMACVRRPPGLHQEPVILPLLQEALMLVDASLVIFRDRTLIEFKTERLDGLHRHEEAGYVSWQIGAFNDHHCHLALDDVIEVEFSAEPVPCQGNRLNYTVWFLVEGPCGNPYRIGGLFSITLNQPYEAENPRLEVIQPVFDLYRRYSDQVWVRADETFLRSMMEGPSGVKYEC